MLKPLTAELTDAGNLRINRFDWERWIRRWPLNIETRALAHTLATFASKHGDQIHPGDDRLALILRCSPRTIRRQRQRLIDEGLIERTRRSPRRGLADEYALTIPADPHATPGLLTPDEEPV